MIHPAIVFNIHAHNVPLCTKTSGHLRNTHRSDVRYLWNFATVLDAKYNPDMLIPVLLRERRKPLVSGVEGLSPKGHAREGTDLLLALRTIKKLTGFSSTSDASPVPKPNLLFLWIWDNPPGELHSGNRPHSERVPTAARPQAKPHSTGKYVALYL